MVSTLKLNKTIVQSIRDCKAQFGGQFKHASMDLLMGLFEHCDELLDAWEAREEKGVSLSDVRKLLEERTCKYVDKNPRIDPIGIATTDPEAGVTISWDRD